MGTPEFWEREGAKHMDRRPSSLLNDSAYEAAGGFRIAVTGHRNLADKATLSFLRRSFGEQLARLRDAHPEGVTVVMGLAVGADTLAAEVAVGGGIPIEVGLASADFIEDFAPGPERVQFLTYCALSRSVHRLPFGERSGAAYLALGHWLVDTCDMLIAAWDGLPARGIGGTGDVVNYARAQRRPIVHLHTVRRTVEYID
jgi:hypothetical protein